MIGGRFVDKTRLTALAAVLLVGVVSVVVAGCGSSSDSSSTSASGGGGETLTVGSDIPYPPFEQGKPGEYTGFDIELMEAIAEKIGRRLNFRTVVRNDLPRRRPGQVRSGDLGGDDHRNAKRPSASRTPTTSRNKRSWSKRAATSKASRTWGDGRRPAGHDRPGTRQGKSQRR